MGVTDLAIRETGSPATDLVARPFNRAFWGGLTVAGGASYLGYLPMTVVPYAGVALLSAAFLWKYPKEYLSLSVVTALTTAPAISAFIEVADLVSLSAWPYMYVSGFEFWPMLISVALLFPALFLAMALSFAGLVEKIGNE